MAEESAQQEEMISAKLAALNALENIKWRKISAMAGFVLLFLSLGASYLSYALGFVVCGIGFAFFGWQFVLNNNEEQRLRLKYKV